MKKLERISKGVERTPVKPGEPLTPEQWADELTKLGWKNGNKELKGPKAFELPGFPNSQPKQD
jgi:hypothetical protein